MDLLPNGSANVLIVDDEPSVARFLAGILSPMHNCHLAESAEAALSAVKQNKFQLVISDINLGGMNGVDMIPLVKDVSPDTVVMMISGSSTMATAVEAMRVGSFDYLSKPFDTDHVQAAVRRAIDHQTLVASKRRYENELERLVEERTTRLRYLEYHDALTNLPNKALLEEKLNQLMVSSPVGTRIAVMLVLIDRLNIVRDALGDEYADKILLQGVERFNECAGPSVTVGRLEDAIFAALLAEADLDNIVILAEKLNERIGSSFDVEGRNFFVQGKIGISIFPGDGRSPTELFKHARSALSKARTSAQSSIQFFTSEMNRSAAQLLAMENQLRGAVARCEIYPAYQPKIDIASGRICGVESLARWRSSELGRIEPSEFIPLAEEIGVINGIADAILVSACRDIKKWANPLDNVHVAVNLSPTQLRERNLVARIRQILDENEFDPAFLNLEITESSIMEDIDSAIVALKSLRDVGIKISMDDFGTGYSSLSWIVQLPLDVLKIDRSFMKNVTQNSDDASLVKAIIELGHTLRLKVVAEGVETEEQLSLLRELGCDEYQGFLHSPPLPFDEIIIRYLANRRN